MHLALRAGKITFTAGPFVLGPGAPALQVDGKKHPLRAVAAPRGRAVWRSARVELAHAFTHETQRRLRVTSTLRNTGPGPLTLNAVVLFATSRLGLGPQPEAVRILEQASYLGRVRTPRQMRTGSDQQTALDGTTGAFTSQMHTLFYNPAARQGLLLGFETVDRWLPNLAGRMFLSAGRMASGTVRSTLPASLRLPAAIRRSAISAANRGSCWSLADRVAQICPTTPIASAGTRLRQASKRSSAELSGWDNTALAIAPCLGSCREAVAFARIR